MLKRELDIIAELGGIKLAYKTNRIAELEKIKDFLNFEDIDKVDKSKLHPFDKESIIEVELTAILLKKTKENGDRSFRRKQ